MFKNIERTVNTVDTLIDSARDAVIGASERAERGVGVAAERVAAKAESAAGQVAVKAGVAAEQVAFKAGAAAEQVAATAHVAAEKAHVAGEYVRGGADSAARVAHERLQSTADAIDRGYAKARTGLSRASAATTGYIAENSGKAVLVAAGAGFLIGFLATRGRRLAPAGI